MNWTWEIRSADGGMNGLEFTRATTAGRDAVRGAGAHRRGEVGLLERWEHAGDRSWWRWSVEFSNHTGRPSDWLPPGQAVQR